MFISTHDDGLSRELYVYGIHEPLLTELMLNEIKKGDVIVEIGVIIGYYSLLESSLLEGTGKIIAIEPDPRSFKILKMNLNLTGYENFKIINAAVGPERRKSTMFLSEKYNLSSVNSDPEKETKFR